MITLQVKESATGKAFSCGREIYEAIKSIADADQETFWVIGLNFKNKEIFRKCLFMGGVSHTDVDPKIVFNRLLKHGAAAWIAVHNHPAGDPFPSPADYAITDRLREGSKILGLELIDHIIVGDGCYFSFRTRKKEMA